VFCVSLDHSVGGGRAMAHSMKDKLAKTIIHGAIALLPIAALLFILTKLFVILKKILIPIEERFQLHYAISAVLVLAILIFAILAACLLIGYLLQTKLGSKLVDGIDSRAKKALPGYEVISNILKSHTANDAAYPPALISLFADGIETLGFVMEDNGGDYLTVYIPSVPVVTVGTIHSVARTRVKFLKATNIDAANCITKWGLGLSELRIK
jgi:uncharacterized membrane protein